MADEKPQQLSIEPVERPLALIPVVIKEAALDSPTFRATAVHFGDQIELIERWLSAYVHATSRLAAETSNIQSIVDAYIQASHPPLQLSEAVVDHDYTVLALKRFGEGAREFWTSTLRSMKRAEATVCEPLRAFVQNDLRILKEARKNLDSTQRIFDGAIARYAGQVKSKEASSLREDAFQLHEARRAYLQASMNFCVMAPQVRLTLDKVLVKVVNEQWRDMRAATDTSAKGFAMWTSDVERVRGWSKEMENGERVFKRELHLARQQIEGAAEVAARPSRDLDSYAASTVPYLGTAPSSANLPSPAKADPANEKAEKQGWLFQRTITGKPARTYWVRRWFFVKDGIFGWLTQGTRSGAVEESEKIGVLLCGIRPAFAEERRFCFEVKTKDTTILLQAETQGDITEWISSFEVAKRKALEDTSKDTSGSHFSDAAFSISPPVAPEFAAKTSDGHAGHPGDDVSNLDRSETLGLPGGDGLPMRGSVDVIRRNTAIDGESSRRDHTARIMEKLDLTRKSTVGPQLSGSNPSSATGGIASLISASLASASHNIVQVGQVTAPAPGLPDTRLVMGQTLPHTTLAPSTLANPPAPTNLSKAAVAVSGERGLGIGRSGNMPGGLMANLWGSVNWGYVNRIVREDETITRDRNQSGPPSPIKTSPAFGPLKDDGEIGALPAAPATPAGPAHRKSMSMGGPASSPRKIATTGDGFPNYYPLALRMQDAQFRILFPTVPRSEKVVLVFRAVWNPTEQQEFPGRIYVTTRDIYFYSNHLGLVLITGLSMSSIDEVTAAPGKDCDFLFLHFKTGSREDGATRLTVKTFLEPLKLLQRRLNFLVLNATSNEYSLEETIKRLIKFEADDGQHSAGEEGWEEVSPDTPSDPRYGGKNIKASLRIDGNLFGPSGANASKNATKFKLPSQPVVFAPAGMTQVAVEKEYEISAKALFHILFGDKSAVFQLLYRERWASRVVQGPWTSSDKRHQRRDFEYEIAQPGKNGAVVINDYQVIEVLNDHLCYVVSDRKTPWYLPGQERFILMSKTVITHVSKARCKLAIHIKVDWKQDPRFAKKLIERQGLQDMELEAQDLVDVVNDQVVRLGHNRNTAKVIGIFGQIGIQTQAVQLDAQEIPPPNRPRKFKLRPQTTGSFIAQYIGNIIFSIFSTVMSSILSIFAALAKVLSAHTFLLTLLLVSGGANFFYTSKDSWGWWNERNAASYMSRLGIGPSTTMTRSIYISDIEESFLRPNHTSIEISALSGSTAENKCHQAFTHLLHDPSSVSASHSLISPSTRSTRRLHRTRQNLGSHRHDLLVALRVVNRLEKEVVEAEYENWLLDETHKCSRVGALLVEAGGKGKEKQVETWVEGYCGDCKTSLERVKEGRTGLA